MARHVVLAIPAYTGIVHIHTMRSIVSDMTALMRRGDLVSIDDESGNTDLADARAVMVAKFLAGNGDDLVFVDNDVSWEAGALLRLLDHPVELVAGIYPRRADPESYPVRYLENKADLWADPTTGLLEVAGAPAGFMRCSRSMLETMTKKYSNLAYDRLGTERTGLFDTYKVGRQKLSEDYSFCQRWRDLGGKVWADPNIRMAHIGIKTFDGHFGDWLRGRA